MVKVTNLSSEIHNPRSHSKTHSPNQNHRTYNKYKNIPKEYLEVAEGMESQYINYMLNELNKSVQSERPESAAEKYYKSLVNSERAKIMAQTDNGVGIKDLVLDQIYPQHMRRPVNVKQAMNQYQNQNQNLNVSNKGVDDE